MTKLPQGWINADLSSVTRILSGYGFPKKFQGKSTGDIPFYKVRDISNAVLNGKHRLGKAANYISSDECRHINAKLLSKNTIVFAKIGEAIKLNRRAILSTNALVDNNVMGVFPLPDALDTKYCYFYLLTVRLGELSKATTVPAVRKSDVERLQITLPPIGEQFRIVAKLEKLLEKVDKCKERLEKIPAILKRFRQSVLAAVYSGELTENWRQENPNVEDAFEILRWLESNRPKKQALPIPIQENIQPAEELPIKWSTVKLKNIISDIRYGTAKKCNYEETNVPVLRIPNVVRGIIDHRDMKYAPLSSQEYKKLRLKKGDILFVRSNGSVSLVGKSAVVSEKEEGFAYAGYLIRIRFNHQKIDPNFINLALSTHDVRIQIEVPARSTSGVNNINSEEVKNLTIPLPPFLEQKEIVNRVDGLFQITDQIEKRYIKAKNYVEQITQSILAKAFRGELVPQDPNDEPASELLKRIQTEKEQAQPQKSKVRKTPNSYRKRKKTIQASDNNRKPEKVEKPERKGPSPVLVDKEAIAQKTKRKPLEAPTQHPPPLVDLDQQIIMASFRKSCRNRGEITREYLLKEVASNLGYRRLSSKLRVKLQGDMRATMMREIIQSNGDMIVPATQNAGDYDRDDLIKFACSVTKKLRLYEEDAVIRDTLLHLGFQRVTERMGNAVASAIRNGIRKGFFVRDKGMIFRP